VLTFVSLYFVQNVFEQRVIADSKYQVSPAVIDAAAAEGVVTGPLQALIDRTYSSANQLRGVCDELGDYTPADVNIVLRLARIDTLVVDSVKAGWILAPASVPEEHLRAIKRMHGTVFLHRCDLEARLRSTTVRSDSTVVRLLDGLTREQLEALVGAFRKAPALHTQ
jgi:inorganic phosphate transporter, PiT family